MINDNFMPTPGAVPTPEFAPTEEDVKNVTPDATAENVEKDDEFKKPKIDSVENNIHNNVTLSDKLPEGKIKVIATQKGFYNQKRINEGEEFYIKSFNDVGSWTKCVDKDHEKKRLAFLKEKKLKARG